LEGCDVGVLLSVLEGCDVGVLLSVLEGCDVGVLVGDIMEKSPNILHITGACALISVGWLTAEYLYR
jgi:hypothetical protein